MDPALRDALARRSTAKGIVTRFNNRIKRCVNEYSLISLEEFDQLYHKLLEAKSQYDNCHDKVVEICSQHGVSDRDYQEGALGVHEQIHDVLTYYPTWRKEIFGVSPARQDTESSNAVTITAEVYEQDQLKLHHNAQSSRNGSDHSASFATSSSSSADKEPVNSSSAETNPLSQEDRANSDIATNYSSTLVSPSKRQLKEDNERLRHLVETQDRKTSDLVGLVERLQGELRQLQSGLCGKDSTDGHGYFTSSPGGGDFLREHRRVSFRDPRLSAISGQTFTEQGTFNPPSHPRYSQPEWNPDEAPCDGGSRYERYNTNQDARLQWRPSYSTHSPRSRDRRMDYRPPRDSAAGRYGERDTTFNRTSSHTPAAYHDGRPDFAGGYSTRGQRSWHPTAQAPCGVGNSFAFNMDQDSTMSFHQMIMNQSQLQHKSFMASLHTPTTKIPNFDGDPLKYTAFMTAFDDMIDSAVDNPRAKLNSLLGLCEGRALSALSSCVHKPAHQGYEEARRILSRKFGNPYSISQAWMTKLLGYPPLKSPTTLEEFASDLVSCRDCLSALGFISELSCTNSIRIIVAKLPFYLRNRWRKIYREGRDREGFSTISQLIDLVTSASDDVTDPIFSEEVLGNVRNTYEGSQPTNRNRPSLKKGSVHITDSFPTGDLSEDDNGNEEYLEEYAFHTSQRPTCAMCITGPHYTSRCRKYKELAAADRLSFVKSKKLCFLCLASTHTTVDCPLPWKCQERDCGRRHHTSLHQAFVNKKVEVHITDSTVSSVGTEEGDHENCENSVNVINHATYFTSRSPTLPLTPVVLRCGDKEITTYALMDNASTLTLCHNRLLGKLGLSVEGSTEMSINTLNSSKKVRGQIVSFEAASAKHYVEHQGEDKYQPVFEAVCLESLPISMNNIMTADRLQKWKHLEGIDIALADVNSVDLLVGQDNSHLLEPLSKKAGRKFEPFGVLTRLGWTVYSGVQRKIHKNNEASQTNVFLTTHSLRPSEDLNVSAEVRSKLQYDTHVTDRELNPDETRDLRVSQELEDRLNKFFSCEDVPEDKALSPDEQKVLDLWDKECEVIDGKIHLPVPFKDEDPVLYDNFIVAYKSLMSLGRRFRKAPQELKQYATAMRDNFSKKYAERVTEKTKVNIKLIWYLCHHGVDHIRKPGVTRIVKNGSKKFKGVCLNDLVFQGPDLMNKLVDVLIRFRCFRKCTLADIVGMFNQVKMAEKHRDCTRFLWWEGDHPDGEVIICRMTTHVFGMCWSPAAAMYALRKTVDLFARQHVEPIRRSILEDFYVDDWLNSEDDSTTSRMVAKGVTETLAQGGFELSKFCCNDREVIASIEPSKRTKELSLIDLATDSLPVGSTLGVGLDLEDDCFVFTLNMKPQPMTRRGLTASVASVYDPLGFLAPFLMPAKVMLQAVCKSGCLWDEELPPNIIHQWARWIKDTEEIKHLKIPRWLGCSLDVVCVIHAFGDASERSYGGLCYLCTEREDGAVQSANIILAKSKLAPTKTQTIPRLEMNAAVVVTKLVRTAKKSVRVHVARCYYWTDSALVLLYLEGDSRIYKTFMSNRTSYIQTHTVMEEWSHVPGQFNPADCLSRGQRAQDLVSNTEWKHGPEFLRLPRDQWPRASRPRDGKVNPEDVKKDRPVYLSCMDAPKVPTDARFRVFLARYSDLNKTVRATAWLIRFIPFAVERGRLHKTGITDRPTQLQLLSSKISVKPPTVIECEVALERLVRTNQALYLTPAQRNCRQFKKYFPQDINGVLRIGGRLANADIEYDVKHPYVVPADCPLTVQVVQHYHDAFSHPGVDRTHQETRLKFWILGGKNVVNKILKRCLPCQRLRAKPPAQLMGDLPTRRVDVFTVPFKNTGVDLFGPLHVIVRRSTEKRYGVLFTCLSSRALHIEVAVDLSTSAFINALQRFVHRRGKPQTISSDHGTNFVCADSTIRRLHEECNVERLDKALTSQGIQWLYNAPAASHQGGAWERLIRAVRQILHFLVRNESLTDDRLNTVMSAAEYIMNTRPLTRVSDNTDSLDVLTPGHLLSFKAPCLLFPAGFSGDAFRRDWRQVQSIITRFWERYIREYLPYLQRRHKWYLEVRDVEQGELVLLINDQLPRCDWPLGVVERVLPGRDGRVRNVIVRTARGRYTRSIYKIVRLEADTG